MLVDAPTPQSDDLLQEKKEKMNMMQLDQDNNEMNPSQDNLLMENIVDLTKALVGSERQGKGVGMDEDSLLIKINYELFFLLNVHC